VHSGNTEHGSYEAFIRPSAENRWFKFSDANVSEATSAEAIDANYGGSSSSSAYMLTYVRRGNASRILERLPPEPAPRHVRDHVLNQ
jgi:ubiquitin carboxyl-terminal hydrolase 7